MQLSFKIYRPEEIKFMKEEFLHQRNVMNKENKDEDDIVKRLIDEKKKKPSEDKDQSKPDGKRVVTKPPKRLNILDD